MKKPASRLGSRELRASRPTQQDLKKIKRREIYIICDNILDTFNIGSIFRLADAVAVKKVYLCGETVTPPNARIAKAAVGTEKWVPWQHSATAEAAIEELRESHSRLDRESLGTESSVRMSDPRVRKDDSKKGIKVIAIEQGKNSVDYRKVVYREPIALVVGHETTGVSKEALKACDFQVEIPMYGVNRSLNVLVSLVFVLGKLI